MSSYTDFAWVYDELMDEIPYENWVSDIIHELKKENINDGLILDLGCGTGIVTELLADAGYDMIGVDISEDMLLQAQEKRAESGHDILYLCQDMREFELYGTIRAVVCICDSLNYLLEEEELLTTFKLVNNYLDPEGLFIFDINTPYKYREVIGDTVIAENREDCSFIWENSYDSESGINEYVVTFFLAGDDGRYDKCEEIHHQKGYGIDTIKKLLEQSGMIFVRAYDTDSHQEITDKTERFTVIARERGK